MSLSIFQNLVLETILNYRFECVYNLSIGSIILYILRCEAIIVYLFWISKLMIISISYILSVIISFFIGYRIKQDPYDKSVAKNASSLIYYNIIPLIWISINGIVYYYSFNFIQPYLWILILISASIPIILDLINLTKLNKLSMEYYFEFNIIEIIGLLFCLITICQQSKININLLIVFIFMIVLQFFIVIIKLTIVQNKIIDKKEIISNQRKDFNSSGKSQ